MHLGNKRAFTLAELLTAVLVISVIMVALAPVITKRMKDSISVQTDNKKGLEIYTNPGSYTFDVPIGINTLFIQGSGGGGAGAGSTYVEKDISFTSTTTWTVPNGVNQITLTIIGAGGGGGGGFGYNKSDTCESGSRRIPYAADNGQDLCVTNIPPSQSNAAFKVVNIGESCTEPNCCWKGLSSDAIHTTVCTSAALTHWCKEAKSHIPSSNYPFPPVDYSKPASIKTPRFISENEMLRLINDTYFQKYLGNIGINLCYSHGGGYDEYNPFPSITPKCNWYRNCPGAQSNNCMPDAFFITNGLGLYYYGGNTKIEEHDSRAAWATLCVRNRDSWVAYAGAGGNSGAKLEDIALNVLPKDSLSIEIGTGGNGGTAGNKGGDGGTTKLIHKRNGVIINTYIAGGGYGGEGAKNNGNGEPTVISNKANSGCTPSNICKLAIDNNSGKGNAGDGVTGGDGAGGTKGGNIDYGEGSNGVGYKGINAGEGGGGGACPRKVQSASSCSSGGKGASGRVDIVYKVALPGGGGGSASRVAGVNGNNKMYEIKYKVAEGDRIVFKVGSGGTGGVEGQDGLNGSATVIGDNDIVFLGGEGGKVATESDKSSLIGGRGGSSGCVNEEDNIQSITSGIKIKNSTTTKYSITPSNGSFKGQAGRRGGVPSSSDIQSGYSINNTVFAYGFSGGMGGSPFNVESSKIGASITCSGGIYGTLGQMTSIKYLCTSGNIKGNDARSHDPVNNEFGGSGGGGGGVVGDSFEQGSGGNGSSGYLRIRWDASEQE